MLKITKLLDQSALFDVQIFKVTVCYDYLISQDFEDEFLIIVSTRGFKYSCLIYYLESPCKQTA